jgi:hypothetical protein
MKPGIQIELSPAQVAEIISEARADLVRSLITQHKDDFDYISPAQTAGILDVNPKTLSTLPIPRYVISVGKVVKYRLSEVRAYLTSIREK